MSQGDPPMEMGRGLHYCPSTNVAGSMNTTHSWVVLIHSNPESVDAGCRKHQVLNYKTPNECTSMELQKVTLGAQFRWGSRWQRDELTG